MDFKLDKAHLLQQELFRSFAEKEIKPLAKDMDESEEYNMELLQKMQKYGFFGIPYAKEYGGAGSDVLAYTLCMEEVSKVDGSTGITISVHTSLCCACINEFGTEDQKQRFLRPLVDGSKIGCYGLTEPGAGSDVQGAQTVAVKDGDDWLITGSKIFTTNSGFADTNVVFAITDRSVPAAKGLTAFIVDLKDENGNRPEGITVSENIERMGIRAASNCIVSYDNVRVTPDRVLGKVGGGFKIAMTALNGGRIGIAAQSVGIAQGALDEAIKYAKERKQFGKPITAFQNTQFLVAELQTKIDAARLMTWRAAKAKDNHEDYASYAAMAKLFASSTAVEVTRAAVQIMGGYGYCREYPVERMYRDAKITEIYEGTSEVMKMVISGGMKLK
ncbi:MAG: acyl-CoA dehydrogenase [Clostridiales bacterium]|nr:acyl-CoA dehydrogenase [Clostridiales bacterium]